VTAHQPPSQRPSGAILWLALAWLVIIAILAGQAVRHG
jgi:hypothetical protein